MNRPQAREAYIRAKYELGSFRRGADGKLPIVAAASSHAAGGIVFAGLLFIRLISASNLPKADSVGKSAYYCEVVLGDRSARSKVVVAHYLSFMAHDLSFGSWALPYRRAVAAGSLSKFLITGVGSLSKFLITGV